MYMPHIKFQDSSISGSRVFSAAKYYGQTDGRTGPNQYAPSTSSVGGIKNLQHTFTSFFAHLSNAAPCTLKILTLAARRSLRSIPAFRGIAPTRKAASQSLNATSGFAVGMSSEEQQERHVYMYSLISRVATYHPLQNSLTFP